MQPTRTKIVATLGPASSAPDTIRRLVKAGVDVFRLNFSHGTRDEHAEYVRDIRQAADELQTPVGIMQDLQGPRIRTGPLENSRPVDLKEGHELRLVPGSFGGNAQKVSVSYQELAQDVEPGDTILLKDGMIELEVTATDGRETTCRVVVGGELDEHQGINLPGVKLSITSPTEKDLDDVRFGIDLGVDFIALSFVRAAGDILRLKSAIKDHVGDGADLPVIAKIEKPEAVENLREILAVSDGAMVARGDLGIEMRTEVVPAVQKRIIRHANRLGLPVITATQMLESMVDSPRPTRAEASDVANAILDGTDAVMLSGETAIGRYPVEAVTMMDRIAYQAQQMPREPHGRADEHSEADIAIQEYALAEAACDISAHLDGAPIVAFTITGSTARYVAQRRPASFIYALTPEEATYRRLALVWGVRPVMLQVFATTDEMIQRGQERLLELGFARSGETVVYVAGASTNTPGGADMIKIHRLQ